MSATARTALQTALEEASEGLLSVRGLYLSGSFGRGIADAYSDLDYVAVTDVGDVAEVIEGWVGLVAAQTPIAHRMGRVFPTSALVNLITEDWVRCDLFVETEERFATRAQDRLSVVFEREPLYATLPPETSVPPVKADALTAAVAEFLRVLGLVHLAVYRDDLFTAQWGGALMRDQIRCFVLGLEPQASLSGALTVSREVSPERRALLQGLPNGGSDMAAVLQTGEALARRFLPMARAACAEHGADWPSSFVRATSRVLRGVMSDVFCDWLAEQA